MTIRKCAAGFWHSLASQERKRLEEAPVTSLSPVAHAPGSPKARGHPRSDFSLVPCGFRG